MRTCEDCKWSKPRYEGWDCLFRVTVPKAAEIEYYRVEDDDETECPTWQPTNPITPKGN